MDTVDVENAQSTPFGYILAAEPHLNIGRPAFFDPMEKPSSACKGGGVG